METENRGNEENVRAPNESEPIYSCTSVNSSF